MLYRNVCIMYRNIQAYILYIQYIDTLQVSMSTHDVVIHDIGLGFQSPNPREIRCFK
jgi:hypothetical protein